MQSERETEQTEAALSEGVALLLQRMKSHPNEFDVEHGKWSHVLQGVYERIHRNSTNPIIPEPWMTRAEVDAVWREYVQLKQRRFHSWVMETLLKGEDDADIELQRRLGHAMAIRNLPIHSPGSWQNVATQVTSAPISSTSIVAKLKQELGIK